MFFSDSWRGPFQRKQVFGNSPHIFFRSHCQVRGLSIVTNSWIGLGICPKEVKFVSNWLEAKEKKHFFNWKKKLSQKREKTLFSKVIKSNSNFLKSLGCNIRTCLRGFHDQSLKISFFREKAKKTTFWLTQKGR